MVFCDRCVYASDKVGLTEEQKQKIINDIPEDIRNEPGVLEAWIQCCIKRLEEAMEDGRRRYKVVVFCKKLGVVKVANPGKPTQSVDVSKKCPFFKPRQ